MEKYLAFDSPANMVPSYARGLPILLVDHDISSLTCLASMLEEYSYKVTTVELARPAVCMIQEQQNAFKLVMANIKMPDMDSHSFLSVLLEKDIPLILMSSDMKTTTAAKFLIKGASFCLEKPISMNDIKYVWQHAFQAKNNKTAENNNENDSEMAVNHEQRPLGTRINDPDIAKSYMENVPCNSQNQAIDPKGKGIVTDENWSKVISESGLAEPILVEAETQKTETSKGKRPITDDDKTNGDTEKKAKIATSESDNTESNIFAEENDKKDEKEKKEGNGNGSGGKRRSIWTSDLHLKFTAAVGALGDKHARPKSILQMMNVPHLTQRQVASHLQKYKAQVQRISETTATNDLKSTSKTCDYPSNYSYPFGASKLAQNPLNSSNSSCDPLEWTSSNSLYKGEFQSWQKAPFSFPLQNQNRVLSPPAGTTITVNGRPEFSLGGKISLNKLPLFSNMTNNNVPESFSPLSINMGSVPPTTASYSSANASAAGYVSHDNSNQMSSDPCVSSYTPQSSSVPSATSSVPEPSFDQMGFVPSAASYAPETNLNQMASFQPAPCYYGLPSSVPSAASYVPETNFNLTDSVPLAPSYAPEASLVPPPEMENQNLNWTEFGVFLDLLGMDQTEYVGGEPAPGDADQFFDWLNDALNGNEETA